MMYKVDLSHLPVGNRDALGIFFCIQARTNTQTCAGARIAYEVEDRFVVLQRLGRPVFADKGEHTVFNEVPFRCAWRIMADRHLHAEAVAEGVLQLIFPQARATPIAAAAIGKDKDTIGVRIDPHAKLGPPSMNGIHGELRRVTGRAHADEAMIPEGIIDAIGDGDAIGIGRKVMIEDFQRFATPSAAGLMEPSDQFAALGIYADHRHSLIRIASALLSDMPELCVPLDRVGWLAQSRFQVLQVHTQLIIHLLEQSSDRIGRHMNALRLQRLGHLGHRLVRPFASPDRIAAGVVFHDPFNRLDYLRRFFSCGRRPAPATRPKISVLRQIGLFWHFCFV